MTQGTEHLPDAAGPKPALKLNFLSHGTLASRDLEFTRRFYQEFFGLEVHRTSPISLMVRLGGNHVYAVVHSKSHSEMPFLNHNGLDVETQAEVDEAHRIACEQAEKWKLHNISKPALQHGTYSFYFWDADDNAWEILTNPKGGYSWLFELGDLEGKGHLDRAFDRPGISK
jgi:catechol 2,3-dioxygenase-like lactoylglutathione lyase family enzyme